jgi:hypothetical protein
VDNAKIPQLGGISATYRAIPSYHIVASQGVEPRFSGPKSLVLPLDDKALCLVYIAPQKGREIVVVIFLPTESFVKIYMTPSTERGQIFVSF